MLLRSSLVIAILQKTHKYKTKKTQTLLTNEIKYTPLNSLELRM